uniref:Uncharacterized protein MANES_18G116100 n=1 Tax=Rhizophora mucronata TaxID=61149 RepID=A0A2P2IZB4_RHIMU
MLLNGLRFFFW